MRIERVTRISDKLAETFTILLPQLTERDENVTADYLEKIIENENTYLLVSYNGEAVVGSLTLVLYHIPTGFKGMIEDVVVDKSARGKGVAVGLMRHALDLAQKRGVKKVELTSNPTRIAANNLYKKIGFKLRKTNFYRYNF